ncbi:MAG: ADP-forming succinate--CoA ligase subunit beta [Gammaproteobacteria bacterium]|nr:ADP-forming succinate--CoA ligase subunit beta [Gammaproteobacteria bacterium]NIR83336.1 ADP-forming succinate--CoA ligase subunit beta [Gammaproteobacteria bacterium]NIR91136.1 ADP-forming succinate--CoA ligase subunit beta [Gammaproteobacteria bacterium]NIU04503.1 ADP-forming succinate--CoA ligase subunit beta [Gammaproteobacteria bacterium]NIW87139.1 ADP-forming succinate--CoA ligase subunit beta [Gammaproteobacteria bacterium]
MNVHEFQAKELLTGYGVPVPRGRVARTPKEAEQAAAELAASRWVVKAQIHAGDRAKAGGIKLVRSVAEVGDAAARLLGTRLVTPQTGSRGIEVKEVLVEEALEVASERYLGVLVDRRSGRVTLIASHEGGMDIEEVAARAPEKIAKIPVDLEDGLQRQQARKLAATLGLDGAQAEAAENVIEACFEAFVGLDASLIEINPLALTAEGELVALDVKMSVDDNALFRHKDLMALREQAGEDPFRLERERHGFNYVKLDGNIGCMVTGAGLALATMDIIKLHGGEPANFLDLPPTARRLHVASAFRHLLEDSDVRAICVNAVGGGMTRCDVLAEGIMTAAREVPVRVPVVVRFAGASTEMGLMLLRNSRMAITFATDLADLAAKTVQAAGRVK